MSPYFQNTTSDNTKSPAFQGRVFNVIDQPIPEQLKIYLPIAASPGHYAPGRPPYLEESAIQVAAVFKFKVADDRIGIVTLPLIIGSCHTMIYATRCTFVNCSYVQY
jgi:hypothetical protein